MKLDSKIISQLVVKDWRLHEKMIAAYIGLAILGLAILGTPHPYTFYMGAVLLITVVVASGFHAITATVLLEYKEQTLPFIMSLPVRPEEYFLSKVFINLLVFGIHWLLVFAGVIFVTLALSIPAGLLPLFILVCVQLLVNYVVILCVAIQTGHEGKSIFAMVLSNLIISPFIMLITNNPEFNQHFDVDRFIWNSTASWILAAQVGIIVTTLVLILILQARRRTFI